MAKDSEKSETKQIKAAPSSLKSNSFFTAAPSSLKKPPGDDSTLQNVSIGDQRNAIQQKFREKQMAKEILKLKQKVADQKRKISALEAVIRFDEEEEEEEEEEVEEEDEDEEENKDNEKSSKRSRRSSSEELESSSKKPKSWWHIFG